MKTNFCLSLSCLIAYAAVAEPRTWSFCEDGKIKFQSGGMSFAKGGRIDAEFLRTDGTNVFLKLTDSSGDGWVPLTSLCDADRAYVAKIRDTPVDEGRLEREAQERETRNRLKAEAIAKEAAKQQEMNAGKEGMELNAKLIANFPERVAEKRGWIEAKFNGFDKGNLPGHGYGDDMLGFSVSDNTGWLDCFVIKGKLDSVLMGLNKGTKVRLTGIVRAALTDEEREFLHNPILKVDQIREIKAASE